MSSHEDCFAELHRLANHWDEEGKEAQQVGAFASIGEGAALKDCAKQLLSILNRYNV